jgi:hypothetical protein
MFSVKLLYVPIIRVDAESGVLQQPSTFHTDTNSETSGRIII